MRRIVSWFFLGIVFSGQVLKADDVLDAKSSVDAVGRFNDVILNSVVCDLPLSYDLSAAIKAAGSLDRSHADCVIGNLADDVKAIVADYLQVSVSVHDLLAMKNRLNQLYALKGYINTGVKIPDQEIKDGVLRLEMTPGRLSKITIASDLKDRYIAGRLDLSEPFNLTELQTQLKLLEKDRHITRIDARVEPTGEIGLAALLLAADTEPKFAIGASIANDRSPSIGSNSTRLRMEANNLTGWGDAFQGSVSTTRGLDAFDVRYSVPVTSNDITVGLEHSRSDSSVIEQPFADLDVDSETESSSIVFNCPLIRDLETTFVVGLTFEKRRNQTSLLGQSFSFSEGALDGESRVTPVRLSLSYATQGMAASLAAKLTVSYGTGAFRPTVDNLTSEAPDGSFTAYLAQAQYARMFTDRFYVTLKLLGQYSPTSLLSVEKFALGGVGSVRGYRQNQVVRDNALLVSAEGNYRVESLPGLDLIAFYDWGSGENSTGSANLGRDTIYSLGAGVTYRIGNGFNAELYIAHGFKDFPVENWNLQDDGIHFRLSYDYRF